MRNAHCRTWNRTRKRKIRESEKYTIWDVKYGEKNEKGEKFRKVHCSTWNMAR
jgi:hypothetical protein